MRVEVDQSGKVNETNRPTAIALANGMRFSIRISARDKRAIVAELRRRYPEWQDSHMYMMMFATLLYFLLREHITRLSFVIIDTEFSGKQNNDSIKAHVMNLCRRAGLKVYKDQITFARVTKKSPSHTLAWRVFKGFENPDRTITARDVLKEFGFKK